MAGIIWLSSEKIWYELIFLELPLPSEICITKEKPSWGLLWIRYLFLSFRDARAELEPEKFHSGLHSRDHDWLFLLSARFWNFLAGIQKKNMTELSEKNAYWSAWSCSKRHAILELPWFAIWFRKQMSWTRARNFQQNNLKLKEIQIKLVKTTQWISTSGLIDSTKDDFISLKLLIALFVMRAPRCLQLNDLFLFLYIQYSYSHLQSTLPVEKTAI